MKRILIIGLIILLSLTGIIEAGDSLSLTLSCTIPEIPGVNAPLPEEKTSSTQNNNTTTEKIEAKKEKATNSDTQGIIQEEKEVETQLANNKGVPVIVQTIYSR